jgi:hypothetical protein
LSACTIEDFIRGTGISKKSVFRKQLYERVFRKQFYERVFRKQLYERVVK